MTEIDMVNHPVHYTRGPKIVCTRCPDCPHMGHTFACWDLDCACHRAGHEPPDERILECIEVVRHIKDPRLFTAMKYIWRVAFGGKGDGSKNHEDIAKAIWYLRDYLDHEV